MLAAGVWLAGPALRAETTVISNEHQKCGRGTYELDGLTVEKRRPR